MRNNRRMDRINDEVKREIAEIIRSELSDPRVTALVSVVKTNVTADLKYCKVYISLMGSEEQKSEAFDAVKNAGGFIRKLLAERVNLRQTPELTFITDDTIEYGVKLSKLIDEVNKPR